MSPQPAVGGTPFLPPAGEAAMKVADNDQSTLRWLPPRRLPRTVERFLRHLRQSALQGHRRDLEPARRPVSAGGGPQARPADPVAQREIRGARRAPQEPAVRRVARPVRLFLSAP